MSDILIPGFNFGGGASERDIFLSEVTKCLEGLKVACSRRLFNYDEWTLAEEQGMMKAIEVLSDKAKLLDHGQREQLTNIIDALEEQEKKGSFNKFKKQF